MAEENRPDIGLTREEKVARLLVARNRLTPPINVRSLAEQYAEIQVDDLPVACDAVAIHRPRGSRRPLILLNRSGLRWETRERFTLSHEIGHIAIPWHCGTVACHMEDDQANVDDEHYPYEAEANSFASELLMPTSWVKKVIQTAPSLEMLVKGVADGANVSHTAARIKILKHLGPGYICVEFDRYDGSILRFDESTGRSSGLLIASTEQSDPEKVQSIFDSKAVDGYVLLRGQRRIQWWKIESRVSVPAFETDKNSSEVLRNIIESSYNESRLEHNARIFIIHGHVGDTNLRALSRDVESIYGALLSRFERSDVKDDPRIAEILNHPEFFLFLAVKAQEISSGNSMKSRSKSRKISS